MLIASSSIAPPSSTYARVPSLRINTFSLGATTPVVRSATSAVSSAAADSGAVSSDHRMAPASRSSREYPMSERYASLASSTMPYTLVTEIAMIPDAASDANRASLIRSACSARLRASRISCWRSSRSTAGSSLANRSFTTKSWAPLRIASTAVSSPMVPDTMMKGISLPERRNVDSASSALNVGIDQSLMTMSHSPVASALCISRAVSTRCD